MSNDSKYSLSRRKALLGLGTVGVAGAGAGVGTSALFSDTESFEDNTLTAGELNLIVDYGTSVDSTNASAAIDGGQANNGTIDGDVSAEYVLGDVKPGDGGFLAFCPKVVDNPAWLWAGSNGLTDSENGLTEPEGEVDSTGGDPGDGNGELSENIQVTVSYCEYTGGDEDDRGNPENYDTIRELNNPDDYTLADLILELQTGFLLDGDDATSGTQAYPASGNSGDQAGPCLCIDWEIPMDVGNEIQSDSVEFDIAFAAEQERNNPDPQTPFTTSGFSSISFEKALNMQALAVGGGDDREVKVHSDSGLVSTQDPPFPTNTDLPLTATLDPTAGTATLDVDGLSVTDNDVTDGDANGASPGTSDPEYPSGVPSMVDVAINASSGGNITTVVKDVMVNGSSSSPDNIQQSSSGTSWLAIPGASTSGGLTVSGTIRFEGSQSDYTSQDWVGIDFR